jgi:hypothetical protein
MVAFVVALRTKPRSAQVASGVHVANALTREPLPNPRFPASAAPSCPPRLTSEECAQSAGRILASKLLTNVGWFLLGSYRTRPKDDNGCTARFTERSDLHGSRTGIGKQ